MEIRDEIERLFQLRGDTAYFGEAVSQKEHALQTAFLAQSESASDSLIIAALLHDIGHLLHDVGENAADLGIDTAHEDVGNRWLSQWFGSAVTEPARLHVAAKRYLCTIDPAYFATLSPASVQSLHLQGGLMTAQEIAKFEAHPHYRDAVHLRRWDDQAKTVGLDVPDVSAYRAILDSVAKKEI